MTEEEKKSEENEKLISDHHAWQNEKLERARDKAYDDLNPNSEIDSLEIIYRDRYR